MTSQRVTRNPFRPTAGAEPPQLIGRTRLLDEFSYGLQIRSGAPDHPEPAPIEGSTLGRVSHYGCCDVLAGQATPAPALFRTCTPPRCNEEHSGTHVSERSNSISAKEHSHNECPPGLRAEEHSGA